MEKGDIVYVESPGKSIHHGTVLEIVNDDVFIMKSVNGSQLTISKKQALRVMTYIPEVIQEQIPRTSLEKFQDLLERVIGNSLSEKIAAEPGVVDEIVSSIITKITTDEWVRGKFIKHDKPRDFCGDK